MSELRRITITATRQRTLRWQVFRVRARCPVCAHEVETLSFTQAAEVLEIDGQALAKLIAAGRVHAIALVNNNQRICQDSLFA